MKVCNCAILEAVLDSTLYDTATPRTYHKVYLIAERVQQDQSLRQTALRHEHPSTPLQL